MLFLSVIPALDFNVCNRVQLTYATFDNTEIISKPVPVAAGSKARTFFGRWNTGIMGSNSTRGMDVCPRSSVLCCPV
jgi:hypothetical protein